MSKLLNTDEMMTVLSELDPEIACLLIARVEFAVTQVALAVARKLEIQCSAATWHGVEFAGLVSGFYPATPGQACPTEVDRQDPGGDWEPASNHVVLIAEGSRLPPGRDLVTFLPDGRLDTSGLRREMLDRHDEGSDQHALGFVDAVESMLLMLSRDSVPAEKLNRALQVCLEGYANNVPVS